jgi:hypothetical protein
MDPRTQFLNEQFPRLSYSRRMLAHLGLGRNKIAIIWIIVLLIGTVPPTVKYSIERRCGFGFAEKSSTLPPQHKFKRVPLVCQSQITQITLKTNT